MLKCAVSSNRPPLGARDVTRFRNSDQLQREICSNAKLSRKMLQFFWRQRLAEIHHRRKAQVGLIVAIETNSFVIAHSRKGHFDLMPSGLEGRREKSFNHGPHSTHLWVGHFQVDLCKLCLA